MGRYDCLFGLLELQRQTYRERGGCGGRMVCPLEMRVGMGTLSKFRWDTSDPIIKSVGELILIVVGHFTPRF